MVMILMMMIIIIYLNCKWDLPGGRGTIRRNAQIPHNVERKQSTQNCTDNKRHITHNTYNYNYNKYEENN
jgi:hypothetical protein